LVESVRYLLIFPIQIVVLHRIPGSSSVCSFARYRSKSLFTMYSVSFGITTRIAISVFSRTGGLASVNPLARLGNIWFETVLIDKCSIMLDKFSQRVIRIARSGSANDLTIMGAMSISNSDDSRRDPILRIGISDLGLECYRVLFIPRSAKL
jgi:hypothetical protein